MDDWASEIVEKLCKEFADYDFYDAAEIAAALRKAKADGMRFAADDLEKRAAEISTTLKLVKTHDAQEWATGIIAALTGIIAHYRAAADKIEKGEA